MHAVVYLTLPAGGVTYNAFRCIIFHTYYFSCERCVIHYMQVMCRTMHAVECLTLHAVVCRTMHAGGVSFNARRWCVIQCMQVVCHTLHAVECRTMHAGGVSFNACEWCFRQCMQVNVTYTACNWCLACSECDVDSEH